MTTPMTKEALDGLRAAAKKHREAYEAHIRNPKDRDAVDAWDAATREFVALIDNDEVNIISALLDELEAKDKRIAELEESHRQVIDARDFYKRLHEEGLKALQSRAESAEQALLLERQKKPEVATDGVVKNIIAAIEKEQDRLFTQDYLMDSKGCIDVIRETYPAGIPLQIQGGE